MWESVDSCRTCSTSVVVCDIGMDDASMGMLFDYDRLKGGLTFTHFSSVDEACMNLPDDGWNLIIFGNEVLHEDSCHFLWDIAHRHDEFDAVAAPIATLFPGDEPRIKISEDIRMFSGRVSRSVRRVGGMFCASVCGRDPSIAPAGLNPNPIWRLAFGENGGFPAPNDFVSRMPRSARRLAERSNYSMPYITTDWKNEERYIGLLHTEKRN
jgi:hypothetical protein